MKSGSAMRISALFITCALLLSGFIFPSPRAAGAYVLPERGLLVSTLSGRDFPLRPGMSGKALKNEIANIVESARTGGYDAIFFEARPAGDSFYRSKVYPRSAFWLGKQNKLTLQDPLAALTKAAGARGIAVYAVINPYYLGSAATDFARGSPAVKYASDCFTSGLLTYLMPESQRAADLNIGDITRLLDRYDIAGVILQGIERPELREREGYGAHLSRLMRDLQGVTAARGRYLGAVVSQSPADSALDTGDIAADFLIPQLTGAADSLLLGDIAGWGEAIGPPNVMPMLMPGEQELLRPTGDTGRLVNQLHLALRTGTTRYCIGSLRAAGLDRALYRLPTAMIDMGQILTGINLTYGRALAITRPTGRLEVTGSTYYIFGLSDPGEPLYMDGEMIERTTYSGLFGKLVDLKMGENRFVFSQDTVRKTVTINRVSPTATRQTTSLSALSPAHFLIAHQGKAFTLTCTGPAGAEVTVSVQGQTVAMQPRTSGGSGTPVIYEGVLRLPDSSYTAGETRAIGPATYVLSYNGRTATYTSEGTLYAAAEDARPAIRVVSQNTSVYIDPAQDGLFLGQLKPDTADYILSESQNYCELQSGGFIRKECCEVIAGAPEITRRTTSVSPVSHGRDDMLFISGGAGVPFLFTQDDTGVTVTLHNLLGFPDAIPPFSDLFERCAVSRSGETVTLRLLYRGDERPWGIDVIYDGNDAALVIRRRPYLSGDRTAPLRGITVVLDPGHGGSDPGALGVAGSGGPDESDLNLAVARVAKAQMEALGATVYLTHEGGADVKLVDRMAFAQDIRPDFFISVHHNSVAETTDAGRAVGTECYYHFGSSGQLADKLAAKVVQASGRYRRGVYQSYYVVTKMSGFPSVLVELGFVSNPLEYEQMTDPYNLFKTAGALTDTIFEMAAGG